ncbi:hypothetical protein [Cedratvirus kamchatka]|uniref:Uncharacterized protein n=1 Tax=Cedratvirus kamchatka TaxID=2716914 RepID=A0A6G8MYW9_9VIRU|nr:hypothetical protein [Cedratvirus kamchatka]WIL04222.1 hypothetical protein Clen_292 [Cedratvirus lena]WIL04848.1 hypothetical protein Cduv_368 [Cedratvirus duvanny]
MGKRKCKIECFKPEVLRQNPVGSPPIVAPPFPSIAYGIASIDTANHTLYIGGLQGFTPDGQLPPTVAARVQNAYAQAFAVVRYYGGDIKDALRFVLYVNPNAPIMDQDPATQGLDFEQRFNYVRDTANAIQAGIYGNNPPARTIIGTTFIVLNDVFELESTWLLAAQPQPQCVPERRCC